MSSFVDSPAGARFERMHLEVTPESAGGSTLVPPVGRCERPASIGQAARTGRLCIVVLTGTALVTVDARSRCHGRPCERI